MKRGEIEFKDNYTPFSTVKQGHMYAIRVVDSTNDFYVLVRVDDVVRANKVMVSYRKVDTPPQKPVL